MSPILTFFFGVACGVFAAIVGVAASILIIEWRDARYYRRAQDEEADE